MGCDHQHYVIVQAYNAKRAEQAAAKDTELQLFVRLGLVRCIFCLLKPSAA